MLGFLAMYSTCSVAGSSISGVVGVLLIVMSGSYSPFLRE
jgi:hypothetical protein